MKNEPDISVIVPIYNVEEYLAECLDSLNNQTKKDIEVIMVDDDSQDSSGEIAKAYAQEHPNFHYYHKENGGLGCARNFGVKHAHGKYIAFMDSDDVLSEDLYEKMFTCAERNNSDITICNVARFNSKRTWIANLHKKVFSNIDTNTHITKDPNLINDTISCNKLILRSFYEKNNFSFPEDILYEDIPVIIPMHFLANNVSVVESSYYFWRLRDGVSKSITQHADDLRNLNDRIKVMKMVDKFFVDNDISEEYSKLKQKKALEIDLMIFVNNCKSMPEELSMQMLEIVNQYIDEAIDDDVFGMLPLVSQQKYAYVREYNIAKLTEVIDYQNNDYYNAEIKEVDGKFAATLPDELFTIEDRDASNELCEYPVKKNVTDVLVKDDGLEITGYIYKSRVNISEPSQQRIKAYLENEFTEELTELNVTQIKDEKITELNGTTFDTATNIASKYNYDGTAFKIDIDLNTLEINEKNQGYNKILICYENRLTQGKTRLASVCKITPNSAVVFENKHIRIEYDRVNELRIFISNEKNFAKDFQADNEKISVELENKADGIYSVDENGERIYFDTTDGKTFFVSANTLRRDITYSLFIQNDNDKDDYLLYRGKKIIIKSDSNPAAVFMTNKNHQVRFTVKDSVTVLNSMKQTGDIIRFKTTTAANSKLLNATKAVLYVEDDIAGGRVVFANARCKVNDGEISCVFSVNFSIEKITKNLYTSMRDMYVAYENNGVEIEKNTIFSTRFYKLLVKFDTLEVSCYRAINGNIRLKATQLWREEENTAQKRKALTAENYPKYREEPIDPMTIVFESMWGAKYSCNPQHLYEYIDKNYPEYKCVWSLNDARTPIKGNGIRVRRGSQEYYHYLATAKYFVNNVNFETAYVKREGQIEIQTMHGTPLKTLGLDVKEDFKNENNRRIYIEKNSRWDYLLVQGEFMKGKAYDCYAFEKKILEYGYPRTDILFNADEKQIKNIKKSLGIPLDKKIILYTPTWRKKGAFDMQLDLEKMRERLGDEYIVIVRLHHLCTPNDAVEADNRFVFDLHSYRSVEDLYLISDILITDYSSVMFDYALLDKPMLFYTYDLADYRDNLRGLYVDIEKEAPGPLVFNTDELINAIENIDAEMDKCRDKITAFKEKYLTYENGESCKLIVNEVMKPSTVIHHYSKIKRKIGRIIRKIIK